MFLTIVYLPTAHRRAWGRGAAAVEQFACGKIDRTSLEHGLIKDSIVRAQQGRQARVRRKERKRCLGSARYPTFDPVRPGACASSLCYDREDPRVHATCNRPCTRAIARLHLRVPACFKRYVLVRKLYCPVGNSGGLPAKVCERRSQLVRMQKPLQLPPAVTTRHPASTVRSKCPQTTIKGCAPIDYFPLRTIRR
jgi:hypothetical protein